MGEDSGRQINGGLWRRYGTHLHQAWPAKLRQSTTRYPIAAAGPGVALDPGASPDLSTVTAALHASAASAGATLTLNGIAIARATDAAERLDSYIDAMRRSGTLKEFNRQFKRRRMEAHGERSRLHELQDRRGPVAGPC
jgi:hypothetical protein